MQELSIGGDQPHPQILRDRNELAIVRGAARILRKSKHRSGPNGVLSALHPSFRFFHDAGCLITTHIPPADQSDETVSEFRPPKPGSRPHRITP